MYILLPFVVFGITLFIMGMLFNLYNEYSNRMRNKSTPDCATITEQPSSSADTKANDNTSEHHTNSPYEYTNNENIELVTTEIELEDIIIDDLTVWDGYNDSEDPPNTIKTPDIPIPSIPINSTPSTKSTNKKAKTLPKSVIRKKFEEKYANKYFPALRITVDNRDLQFCPNNDGAPLFKARAIFNSERFEEAKCCPICSTAFIKKEEFIGDFRTGLNTLWVCKFVQTCSHQKHHVVSATGILCKSDLSKVEINIQYCRTCQEYFISKSQYEKYKIIYRNLMGNLKFIDSLKNKASLTDAQFNLESPLHINGYSVSQNSKLTTDDRRRIIGYIIDNNIMKKSDVIYYLSMFIERAQQRKHADMTNAISKWESDLHWVNYYNFKGQYQVQVQNIEIKPKKHYR